MHTNKIVAAADEQHVVNDDSFEGSSGDYYIYYINY